MEVQTHGTDVQHKYHHDSRPYAVASAEAAKKARNKLMERFEFGKQQLGNALQSVETYIPQDALVPHAKINFDFSNGKLNVGYAPKDAQNATFFGVHDHAYGQLLEKADIPKKYADRLITENPKLLIDNLRARYHEDKKGSTFLARAVQTGVERELRGWLSDSYGIYDTKPMVEAFLQTCMEYQAVPVQAKNLPTRFFLKMMIPIVFEPIQNEVVAFGIQFRDSDYGDGAYEVRGFVSRVWCTNDAMTEESLKQVHLGPRLTAANFSKETLQKQGEMLVSATRDTVRGILKPQNIERRLELIKVADEKQIPIGKTLEAMRKNGELTKSEADRINEVLTSSDVEVLPPVREVPKKGHTSLYRFANAFSWLAKDDGTDERRAMDLEMISGKVLGIQAGKKKEEEVVA